MFKNAIIIYKDLPKGVTKVLPEYLSSTMLYNG
jgi:hypothetical protein